MLKQILTAILVFGVVLGITTGLSLTPYKLSTEEISKRVLPTMVKIGVAESGNPTINTVCSGVVVRSDGYVLTAKHCISESAHVFVKMLTGKVYTAVYIIVDAQQDLALLKVETRGDVLPELSLGGSYLSVGQNITVFGFPAEHMIFGAEASVSRGIISALERTTEEASKQTENEEDKKSQSHEIFEYQPAGLELLFGTPKVYTDHMIQFDAMANPGSSGGAIVDNNGRLIGIVVALISLSGSHAGLNFGIPIDDAIRILSAMTPRGD